MSIKLVEFWCAGKPRPKGSWTPIAMCSTHGDPKCEICTFKRGSRVFMDGGEALSAWSKAVAEVSGNAYRSGVYQFTERAVYLGPVKVEADFFFDKPAKGTVEPYPTTKTYGDGDKLTRAIWDALVVGRVLGDDRQVVSWGGAKAWAYEGASAGALVRVETV